MLFIWLFVGIVLVSVAYFLPGRGTDLWPMVNAGGAALAVYLIALMVYAMRKPFSKKTIVISWCVFLFFALSTAFWWRTIYHQSHWQRTSLNEILVIIDEGMLISESFDALFPVFQTYYNREEEDGKTLGEIFLSSYEERIDESKLFHFDYYDYHWGYGYPLIYAASVTDDRIMLVSQGVASKGRDEAFENFDGSTGKLQIHTVLTERGITHERTN